MLDREPGRGLALEASERRHTSVGDMQSSRGGQGGESGRAGGKEGKGGKETYVEVLAAQDWMTVAHSNSSEKSILKGHRSAYW